MHYNEESLKMTLTSIMIFCILSETAMIHTFLLKLVLLKIELKIHRIIADKLLELKSRV